MNNKLIQFLKKYRNEVIVGPLLFLREVCVRFLSFLTENTNLQCWYFYSG